VVSTWRPYLDTRGRGKYQTEVARALALLLLAFAPAVAIAADVAGAPLPKRARKLDDGRYASPMGFRDTVEWYRKELRRRGESAELVGPVRYRDVVFVRVLAGRPGGAWQAVHIVLADGRTTIYILAASNAAAPSPKHEN
jgi:hypothetical protein